MVIETSEFIIVKGDGFYAMIPLPLDEEGETLCLIQ